MYLILIRHGHKTFLPTHDPTLSDKGFSQAGELLKLVEKSVLPIPNMCWVSDSQRTYQTVEKIIKHHAVQYEKTDQLSVRHSEESNFEFRNRVAKTINSLDQIALQSRDKVYMLCTHFDWIEEAMSVINCDQNLTSFEYSNWAPAQYMVFEIKDSTWFVRNKGVVYG